MSQASDALAQALRASYAACAATPDLHAGQVENGLNICQDSLRAGQAHLALPLLQLLAQRGVSRPRLFSLLGHGLRLEQRLLEAREAFAKAKAMVPDDIGALTDLAQIQFELGLPAAELFGEAVNRSGGRLDLIRRYAAALVAEGRAEDALATLKDSLVAHPEWLDGHKSLASFLWLEGEGANSADSLAEACQKLPNRPELWMTWFQLVAQARNWAKARAILDEAEVRLGATPALMVARLFLATESMDQAESVKWLAATRHISGDGVSLCRIRHAIRLGDFEAAEREISPRLQGPSAALFWPYASIVWRLMGDDRAEWLDRPNLLPATRDAGLSNADLQNLAETLRALHIAQRPYPEQSVRGGTQTDRSVLLRHEPILVKTRQALMEVLADYVSHLPPPEPDHPLLSAPRGNLAIEGSWSVRLSRQGYNVPHTHPKGWLSTAFYVSIPKPDEMGPAPAGFLALGTPPVELATGLGAMRHIAPAPGRLAIFPSTLWHSTEPFDDGERLVIAFDVRRPER